MTNDGKNLVATVLILLLAAIGTALIDRWAHRESLLPKFIKRRAKPADCPWPVDDERPAHVFNSPQHNARDCQ